MARNITTETLKSVDEFIYAIQDEVKHKDSLQIIRIFQKQCGFKPKMWGPSIIGFGTCHYKYESGREGDMPLAAFSPRTTAIDFYLSANVETRVKLLKKLGKHKTDKGCIYVKKLDDINMDVLKEMISVSVKHKQSLCIAETMRESGEALVAKLGNTKGLKVLDLGCGDGTTALPEARLGANVLGVDIARNLVDAGNISG